MAVGISSGANFLGALKKLEELGEDKTVVTVFADDSKKYLSTGLMKKEPVKSDFLSPDVQLKSFRAYRRSCVTCCNPEECEAVTNPEIIKEINLPHCYLRNARCSV
jgi:cysteine synthase A